MAERKCVTLTLIEKRRLLRHKQENPKINNSALSTWATDHFKCNVSNVTIGRILRQKDKLLALASAGSSKRVRLASLPELEHLLYQWFLGAQEEKLCISDDLLIEKAKQIYNVMKQVDAEPFKFSNGWLYNFKRRHSITCRVLHGEAGSVELTEDVWDQIAALKARLSDYEPEDIFNFDETALFYKLQPNRTLRDQIVNGEKKSKERLSVGLCANSTGTIKFPPVVINRYKRPRAFSRRSINMPENLGIMWYANPKAWMTTPIFQDYLLKFDAFLHKKGRKKVVLLVDNASSHKWLDMVEKLKITRVLFLPANTTARFQPMDAGIIRSFKAQYRRLMVQRMVRDYDKGIKIPLDVYDAVTMLERAWTEGVTKKTIENCWIHCGLARYVDNRPDRQPKDLDLNAKLVDFDLNVQLDQMQDIMWDLSTRDDVYDVSMNARDWIAVDEADPDDVDGADQWLDSVLQKVAEVAGDGEAEVDVEEVEAPVEMESPVQFSEAKAATQTIRRYLQQSPIEVFDLLRKLKVIDDWIEGEHHSSLKQTKVDNYFKLIPGEEFNVAGYGTFDVNL